MIQGNGYLGSPNLQTSTGNQEIIPTPPTELKWTQGYKCYKFSFANDQSCSVKINNGNPIYLRDGQGFESNEKDAPIFSFVIVESGITYNFIAAY